MDCGTKRNLQVAFLLRAETAATTSHRHISLRPGRQLQLQLDEVVQPKQPSPIH